MSTHTNAGSPSQRRSRWTIAGAVLLTVAAAIAGTLGLLRHRVASNLEFIDDPFAAIEHRPTPQAEGADSRVPESGDDGEPVTILMLGSDSRISAGDPTEWEYGAQRTDAIMLVHIAGDRQSAQVMSIPRDSWVPIPGHGENKINASYSFGGPSLLIETVENLTGVQIDHFAVTDFESFADLTDELGGVEITVNVPVDRWGVQIDAGTHRLSGEEALAYVRERYDLPGGDFDRVQRQQNWMRAILREAVDAETLTNPLKVASLLETAAGAVAVDEGFTVDEMSSLALSLRDLRPDDLTFLTVPVAGTDWSDDGQSIVVLDSGPFDALMDAVADDTVAAYLDEHEVETLGAPEDVL